MVTLDDIDMNGLPLRVGLRTAGVAENGQLIIHRVVYREWVDKEEGIRVVDMVGMEVITLS